MSWFAALAPNLNGLAWALDDEIGPLALVAVKTRDDRCVVGTHNILCFKPVCAAVANDSDLPGTTHRFVLDGASTLFVAWAGETQGS